MQQVPLYPTSRCSRKFLAGGFVLIMFCRVDSSMLEGYCGLGCNVQLQVCLIDDALNSVHLDPE